MAEAIRTQGDVGARWFRSVAVATSLLLAGVAANAAPPPIVEPRPPAITVVKARFGTIAEVVGLTGTLVPREEVLVSPQIGDLAITDILVEEGDKVTAGQVLARLSRDALETSLAQNAAQLARADAAIAQARAAVIESAANKVQADLAFARSQALVGSGNAPREQFEQRQAAAQTAAARLEANQNLLRAAEADQVMAEAQRREWMIKWDRTEIKAPVAGVISRRTAHLGSMVQGMGEPLFRIIADGAIELEADVPEVLLTRLAPGEPAKVETAGGTRDGVVRLVSPEVSRTTRLGRVRVAITGDGPLAIGSFGRASVEIARHEGVLVPLSAVLFQPDGTVVQVVNDSMVETRQVQVGLRANGLAEITEGVRAGEDVVEVSGTFVRAGDRVTAVPKD
jgi:HlyD family secretion protein